MKITRNTTVKELKDFIGANVSAVKKKDKELFDRISYADKQLKADPKKVTRADLAGLAKDVIKLLGDAVSEVSTPAPKLAVVENNTKPAEKSTEKKKLSASNKKTAEKSTEKTKEQPKTETKGSKMFPAELNVDGDVYTLAENINSMEDLLKAYNEDREFVFAFVWTKTQLKQYSYANGTLDAPKEFENDLDLTSTLHVSDECKVCYNLSMYTEALYQIMPNAFEELDGIRYSDGIEFQIYEKR